MHLHGLASMAQVKQGNTIKDPKFLSDDTAEVRQFERVTANFPFSEENWWLNGNPTAQTAGRGCIGHRCLSSAASH